MLSATCHMEKMATRLRSGNPRDTVYNLLMLLQKHKSCQDLTRNVYSVLEKYTRKFMQKAAEKKMRKSGPFSSFKKILQSFFIKETRHK
jgi:hypothetical protein